jgi:hypothetical protein
LQIEPAVFLFKDFHPFAEENRANLAVIRRLRDVAYHLRDSYKTIVIVAPMAVSTSTPGRLVPKEVTNRIVQSASSCDTSCMLSCGAAPRRHGSCSEESSAR